MIEHRWEYVPLMLGHVCVPFTLPGGGSERCQGCNAFVGDESLARYPDLAKTCKSATLDLIANEELRITQ